jgi:predicted small integral membrane protein
MSENSDEPEIDYKEMIVMDAKCYDAEGDPRIGLLAIETVGGLHQLFVSEATANLIIQELRAFLADEVERLP